MMCDRCKKELKRKPIKEAIKDKDWWKQELKDFGWGNLLIIISILLVFSGLYFEFGPKIKNPCDWCKIRVSDSFGEEHVIVCSDIANRSKENPIPQSAINPDDLGRFDDGTT